MQEKVEFKRQREFGEIIGDTFLFLKQNLKPMLKVFLYLCGFFILASILSTVVHLLGQQKVIMDPARPMAQISSMFTLSYALVILLYLATYTAITVSTLSFIALYIEKGNVAPEVEEVWSYFKYFFLRVFSSTIPVLLTMAAGIACCIIPGIYVFPALSLFYSVMIFENGSFGYSFGRAFKLANLDWWGTAAAMLIIWIITYAAVLIPTVPLMIVNMASVFTPGVKEVSVTMMIISTVVQHLTQVFTIFPVVGVALCYFNLAERLENGGLLGRIKQMGQDKDRFNSPEEY